jgi:hypothetical protein
MTNNQKTLSYTSTAVERARRALICSPFNLALLQAMGQQSLPLSAIAMENGLHHGYTKRMLSELACDDALGWLIQVGILRREVDGQGITDSFRLTPLGHFLVEQFHGNNWPNASWSDRLYNAVVYWFRLPF